ncbi:hypothetical protein LQ327_31475 [Actinomycetospora endophytica]|uniref:MftR C-terminal domain-containing protein n=1 Tax=Actinomycetospora endophytica TaxID=2291215 RepID=A0ABS8PK71_9PSEU|nr:hypothetical protein [Actinomycetospora endophytica]MCD2197900.1 hypothetical protein [Actinomycetospora endophytica]
MNPDAQDQQNDRGEDGWGDQPMAAETPTATELAELQEAAVALRDRIASPGRYPPFPREVTLLMAARLLETIAEAGPTPTPDRWQTVVDAADEIAHHVRRNGPTS